MAACCSCGDKPAPHPHPREPKLCLCDFCRGMMVDAEYHADRRQQERIGDRGERDRIMGRR